MRCVKCNHIVRIEKDDRLGYCPNCEEYFLNDDPEKIVVPAERGRNNFSIGCPGCKVANIVYTDYNENDILIKCYNCDLIF